MGSRKKRRGSRAHSSGSAALTVESPAVANARDGKKQSHRKDDKYAVRGKKAAQSGEPSPVRVEDVEMKDGGSSTHLAPPHKNNTHKSKKKTDASTPSQKSKHKSKTKTDASTPPQDPSHDPVGSEAASKKKKQRNKKQKEDNKKKHDSSSSSVSNNNNVERKGNGKNKKQASARGKRKGKGNPQANQPPLAQPVLSADEIAAWDPVELPDLVSRSVRCLGFTSPTPIQQGTLPGTLVHRRDCIGAAETGSGKTLCFILPVLVRWIEQWQYVETTVAACQDKLARLDAQQDSLDELKDKKLTTALQARADRMQAKVTAARHKATAKYVRAAQRGYDLANRVFALMLAPTRELAVQIQSVVRSVLASWPYRPVPARYWRPGQWDSDHAVPSLLEGCYVPPKPRVGLLVGGLAQVKQLRVLAGKPNILVCTVGRLWDHIQSESFTEALDPARKKSKSKGKESLLPGQPQGNALIDVQGANIVDVTPDMLMAGVDMGDFAYDDDEGSAMGDFDGAGDGSDVDLPPEPAELVQSCGGGALDGEPSREEVMRADVTVSKDFDACHASLSELLGQRTAGSPDTHNSSVPPPSPIPSLSTLVTVAFMASDLLAGQGNAFGWLRVLAVDEADRMLASGGVEELGKVLEVVRRDINQYAWAHGSRLSHARMGTAFTQECHPALLRVMHVPLARSLCYPIARQTLLFSATLSLQFAAVDQGKAQHTHSQQEDSSQHVTLREVLQLAMWEAGRASRSQRRLNTTLDAAPKFADALMATQDESASQEAKDGHDGERKVPGHSQEARQHDARMRTVKSVLQATAEGKGLLKLVCKVPFLASDPEFWRGKSEKAKPKAPLYVNLSTAKLTAERVSEQFVRCSAEGHTGKDNRFLYHLLDNQVAPHILQKRAEAGSDTDVSLEPAHVITPTILFTNSISTVKRLMGFLRTVNVNTLHNVGLAALSQGKNRKGSSRHRTPGRVMGSGAASELPEAPIPVVCLHGKMTQKQRLKCLDKFKAFVSRYIVAKQQRALRPSTQSDSSSQPSAEPAEWEGGLLVCTDVAARGLDIPNVPRVFHFHVPRVMNDYIHRCGRCGRAGKHGSSLVFVSPGEESRFGELCRRLGRPSVETAKPRESTAQSPGSDTATETPASQGWTPIATAPSHIFLKRFFSALNEVRKADEMQNARNKALAERDWLLKTADELDILLDDHMEKYVKDLHYKAVRLGHAADQRLSAVKQKRGSNSGSQMSRSERELMHAHWTPSAASGAQSSLKNRDMERNSLWQSFMRERQVRKTTKQQQQQQQEQDTDTTPMVVNDGGKQSVASEGKGGGSVKQRRGRKRGRKQAGAGKNPKKVKV